MFNAKKHIATLQRHWAADAFRDEKYNIKRAKQVHNPTMRAAYMQEARWDRFWGNRRLRIARKNSR